MNVECEYIILSFLIYTGRFDLFIVFNIINRGRRYLLGQRFSACFVLKLVVPQRGEGEKREGVQISEQSTQNL